MSLQQYNDIFSEPFDKQLQITVEGTDIVLTNSDICEESMSLEDSICSEENLRFGTCEAKCFKIRVVNSDIVFKDKWLTVVLLCDLPDVLVDSDGNHIVNDEGDEIALATNESTSIALGRFKVFSDEPSNDRSWRDLTCYDEMNVILNANVASWYSALTFPMTIKNLRDSFFTYLGITQETVTLTNDSFITQGGFVAEGELSGKVIIEAICELNGVFGHMNPNGKFGYIDITATDSATLSYYEDGTGKYSDYVTDAITGVLARGSEDDVGTSVGITTNVYVIENNPLVFGSEGTQGLTTALTNLLNKISTISFRPYEVSTYGNPMLSAGSGITVVTRDVTINSIVISKTMNGIQALRDNLGATSDKSQPSMVNNVQSQISRTKGKIHLLRVDVDELSSEIYEIDPQTGTKTSKITQLAGEIVLKVDNNGNIVKVALGSDSSTGTVFTVEADNMSLSATDVIDFLSGGSINMTSKNISITSTNFSVTNTGEITCKSGKIGPWSIGADGLSYSKTESGVTNSATMYYTGIELTTNNNGYKSSSIFPGSFDFLRGNNGSDSMLSYGVVDNKRTLKYTYGNYEVYIGEYYLNVTGHQGYNHGVMVKNGTSFVALTRGGDIYLSGTVHPNAT